jgi:UDP-glucose 4-epimerase
MNSLAKNCDLHRVLVLGHTGFIGEHLVRYFRGHSPELELVGRSLPSLDLTKEEEATTLADLMDLKTVVVMCAAIKKQWGDSLDVFSQNVKMVTNVCRVLQSHPVRRFVYFSSAAVYGEDIHNTKINEETPINPTSFYGTAKYVSERLLQQVIGSHKNCSLLILRPPLVYGPGDRSRGYGPSGFVCSALNGEKIVLWGDGSEQREFVFVEDIAKIVHDLSFHHYTGAVNVASGESYTYENVLEILADLVPVGLQIASRPRTKEKVDHGFCNQLLVELLPDVSFSSFGDGIGRTLNAESRTGAASEGTAEGQS